MASTEQREACDRLHRLANEAAFVTERWLSGRHNTWKQDVTIELGRLGEKFQPHLAKIISLTSMPNTETDVIPAQTYLAWFESGVRKSAEIVNAAIREFEHFESNTTTNVLQEAERLLPKLTRAEKALLAQRLVSDLENDCDGSEAD